MSEPLLEVNLLCVHFPFRRGGLFRAEHGLVRAVDGVSFQIKEGETLGLVGESGCGKSTTARAIIGLVKPTSGEVRLQGKAIQGLSDTAMRPHRRIMQMVFQDPFASLNPRMTVGSIIAEPLAVHGLARGKDRQLEVVRLMELVGLNPRYLNRYPHEFSGGQRQRIGIARALAVQPKLILCDEPISALDVSIQAQIINLLMDLQQQLGLSYLFIAHDLAVVRHIATRVGVMYLGRLVEVAEANELYRNPIHPYTQALLSAVPVPDPGLANPQFAASAATIANEPIPTSAIDAGQESQQVKHGSRIILQGEVPSPDKFYPGCTFCDRCWLAESRCRQERPELIGSAHAAACWVQQAANTVGSGADNSEATLS